MTRYSEVDTDRRNRRRLSVLVAFAMMASLVGFVGSEGVSAQVPADQPAEWMAGEWGVGWRMPPGGERFADGQELYDAEVTLAQIQRIEGISYVLINISAGADGLTYTAPHSVLSELCDGCTPQGDRDLFLETITLFKDAGYKVLVYAATEGPAKLKHGPIKAFDYDAATGSSPAVDAWTAYVRDELYPDLNATDIEKYKRAYAEIIIDEYAARYGTLIDGWWFDHASNGDIPLLYETITKYNPDTIAAFNDGQKVPLVNNNPGYESYTFGHPNPVANTLASDDANLPMLEAIEATPDGYFETDDEYSLGHMFMPLQTKWNSGDIVWTQELAAERLNRAIAANGAWTWNIGTNRSDNGGDWSELDLDAIDFLAELSTKIVGTDVITIGATVVGDQGIVSTFEVSSSQPGCTTTTPTVVITGTASIDVTVVDITNDGTATACSYSVTETGTNPAGYTADVATQTVLSGGTVPFVNTQDPGTDVITIGATVVGDQGIVSTFEVSSSQPGCTTTTPTVVITGTASIDVTVVDITNDGTATACSYSVTETGTNPAGYTADVATQTVLSGGTVSFVNTQDPPTEPPDVLVDTTFDLKDPIACGGQFVGAVNGAPGSFELTYTLSGPRTIDLGSFTVAGPGPFTAPDNFVNYATTPAGTYTVEITAVSSDASVGFAVFEALITDQCGEVDNPASPVAAEPIDQETPARLALTGGSSAPLAALAMLLIAMGAALSVGSRRRPTR